MEIKKREKINIKDGRCDIIDYCTNCGDKIISKALLSSKGNISKYLEKNFKNPPLEFRIVNTCDFTSLRNTRDKGIIVVKSNKRVCFNCFSKITTEVNNTLADKEKELLELRNKIKEDRDVYIKENIEFFDDIVSEILNKVILTLNEIYFNFHLKNGKDVSIKDITAVKFVKGWVNIETEKGDYHFYNESYETNYRYEDFNKKKPSIFRKAGKKGSYIRLTEEETKKYSKHTCEDVKKAEPHYYEDSQGIYL